MKIILDNNEMRAAKQIFDANQAAYSDRHKYGANDRDMKAIGMDGFAAELAVARFLGIDLKDHTPSIQGSDNPDVGVYDVRQTRYSRGRLLLHKPDKDDRVTIFVTGTGRTFFIRGWLRNRDGKQERFWQVINRKANPCYAIPQSELQPMYSLPAA